VSIVDFYYSHTLILLLAIIIGCIIYLVGGALQTGAQNLNYLWAGRWIAGLGVGFLVMIVPIYQYVFPVGPQLLNTSITTVPLLPPGLLSRTHITNCDKRSEIAHPSVRGTITALQQFMLGIGAFVAGWVSYGTYIGLTSTAQWRLPLGLQMLPAVGLAALIFLFPESPR
jgi:MFS family permease